MPLTSDDIANAELDVAALAAVVNGATTDPDVVTRTGRIIKPLAKVLFLLATAVLTPPDYIGPKGDPGANVMAVGLFTDLHTVNVPLGTTLIHTSGYNVPGKGHATYVEDAALDDAAVAAMPRARVKSANNRYFRLSYEQFHNPQMFGAAANDDANAGTDDFAAFVAARDFLQSVEINPSPGAYYTGSPHLDLLGCYYLDAAGAGALGLEFFSGTQIIGHGSGRTGAGGGAASRLRFSFGSHGIIEQFPNTSDVTTVDAGTHKGSPGFTFRGFKIEGSFAGVEGDWHGLIIRSIPNLDDMYIKLWPGEGIKGWAGTILDFGYVSGNLSTGFFRGVKVQDCRGGWDIRGGDANIITVINCEAYQNRRFGFLDDNGAGSNSYVGCHTASNGLITGAWPQTQCSYLGERYALTPTGDPTVAPSGTTAHTANWRHIEAGGAVANLIPAWINTPGTFRFGGDYITLNNAGVRLDSCYSEYGGFSHFNTATKIDEGTIGDQYHYSGIRDNSSASYGRRIRQNDRDSALTLQHGNTQAALFFMDGTGVSHGAIVGLRGSGNWHYAWNTNGHLFFTMSASFGGGATLQASITTNGLELRAGGAVFVNGQQVVGARGAALPRIARVATAGALPAADGSITIANAAAPTNAELLEYCTELEAQLEALTARLRAATGSGAIA